MIDYDKILVFDDIIDKQHQNKIKDLLFGKTFSWFYYDDISKENNEVQRRPGFGHYFLHDKKVNSEFHNEVNPIIAEALKKANIKHTSNFQGLQGRSFFQLPLNIPDRHIVDTPHVDTDIPHLAILYYVNDSDGDTIIYENIFEGYDKIPHKKDLVIKQKISPKMGRVVVFNGKYWHTAEQPTYNERCIINYNVI